MFGFIKILPGLSLLFLGLGIHDANSASSNINIVIECERLLRKHIQQTAQPRPWAELPLELANVGEATLLIRLPMGLTNDRRLSALARLVEENSELSVPEPLKIVIGFGLFTVVRGSGQSLLKLHEKIRVRLAGEPVQYQILNYTAVRDLTVPLPDKIIRADSEIAAMIENKGEAFAAFSRARGGQLLFFIPRETLAPLFEMKEFDGARLRQYHMRVEPKDWSAWMEDKADFFKGRSLVLSRYWVVLSSAALEAMKNLEAEYRLHNSPTAAPVETALLSALDRCLSEVCDTASTLNDTISYAGRKLILDFLKEHRKSVAISDRNGIRQAFLALGDLIENRRDRTEYLAAIRDIPFVATEYIAVMVDDVVTNSAIERLTRAWRTFMRAKNLHQANAPLTLENIKAAVVAADLSAVGHL